MLGAAGFRDDRHALLGEPSQTDLGAKFAVNFTNRGDHISSKKFLVVCAVGGLTHAAGTTELTEGLVSNTDSIVERFVISSLVAGTAHSNVVFNLVKRRWDDSGLEELHHMVLTEVRHANCLGLLVDHKLFHSSPLLSAAFRAKGRTVTHEGEMHQDQVSELDAEVSELFIGLSHGFIVCQTTLDFGSNPIL